jgi:hypothetical protein
MPPISRVFPSILPLALLDTSLKITATLTHKTNIARAATYLASLGTPAAVVGANKVEIKSCAQSYPPGQNNVAVVNRVKEASTPARGNRFIFMALSDRYSDHPAER